MCLFVARKQSTTSLYDSLSSHPQIDSTKSAVDVLFFLMTNYL